MTSYQQSPSRSLEYYASSSVPITSVCWDGRADDDFGLYPVEVEQYAHRQRLTVAMRELGFPGQRLMMAVLAIVGALFVAGVIR
jgi:hypothetical protein